MDIWGKIKLFFKKAVGMANDEDEELNWVDYALAFISGAAIGYVIAKALSGGIEHFECPNCHFTFAGKLKTCPRCSSIFRW